MFLPIRSLSGALASLKTRGWLYWLANLGLMSLAHPILCPSTHLLALRLLPVFLHFPPAETQHVAGPTPNPTHPTSLHLLHSWQPTSPREKQEPRGLRGRSEPQRGSRMFPFQPDLPPQTQPFPLNTAHYSGSPAAVYGQARSTLSSVGTMGVSQPVLPGKGAPDFPRERNCCNYRRPPRAPGSCCSCCC